LGIVVVHALLATLLALHIAVQLLLGATWHGLARTALPTLRATLLLEVVATGIAVHIPVAVAHHVVGTAPVGGLAARGTAAVGAAL
jgi:hypothetical protein